MLFVLKWWKTLIHSPSSVQVESSRSKGSGSPPKGGPVPSGLGFYLRVQVFCSRPPEAWVAAASDLVISQGLISAATRKRCWLNFTALILPPLMLSILINYSLHKSKTFIRSISRASPREAKRVWRRRSSIPSPARIGTTSRPPQSSRFAMSERPWSTGPRELGSPRTVSRDASTRSRSLIFKTRR